MEVPLLLGALPHVAVGGFTAKVSLTALWTSKVAPASQPQPVCLTYAYIGIGVATRQDGVQPSGKILFRPSHHTIHIPLATDKLGLALCSALQQCNVRLTVCSGTHSKPG